MLILIFIHTCLSVGPCIPQKVTAEMVCSNDTGVVSWEEGEGVSSYMVQAFGPNGHKIKCDSTETSCELPNMQCGQLYNLTVTAQDGQCDNSHAYLNLQSGKYEQQNLCAMVLVWTGPSTQEVFCRYTTILIIIAV